MTYMLNRHLMEGDEEEVAQDEPLQLAVPKIGPRGKSPDAGIEKVHESDTSALQTDHHGK